MQCFSFVASFTCVGFGVMTSIHIFSFSSIEWESSVWCAYVSIEAEKVGFCFFMSFVVCCLYFYAYVLVYCLLYDATRFRVNASLQFSLVQLQIQQAAKAATSYCGTQCLRGPNIESNLFFYICPVVCLLYVRLFHTNAKLYLHTHYSYLCLLIDNRYSLKFVVVDIPSRSHSIVDVSVTC